MSEVEIDYPAICQRMIKGIQEARQVLEETEKDCQKIFDHAIYSQMEESKTGELRHEFLQRAAEIKRKLFE